MAEFPTGSRPCSCVDPAVSSLLKRSPLQLIRAQFQSEKRIVQITPISITDYAQTRATAIRPTCLQTGFRFQSHNGTVFAGRRVFTFVPRRRKLEEMVPVRRKWQPADRSRLAIVCPANAWSSEQ